MRALSKDEVVKQLNMQPELVPAPELGKDAGVYICKISPFQWFQAQEDSAKYDDKIVSSVYLAYVIVQLAMCDEAGVLMFNSFDEVQTLDAKLVTGLMPAILKKSGLDGESFEDAGKN